MNVPADLKYTPSHEWVRVEDHKYATVGITDHAQHELTDVVFVELPGVGRQVEAGSAVATVESVKAASDIYAPVSGEILEVNGDLPATPAALNKDPYGSWLFRILMRNPAEAGKLLDADAYRRQIGA